MNSLKREQNSCYDHDNGLNPPLMEPSAACPTIFDVIGDLLTDGRQVEEFFLDKAIFGFLSKLPIHGCLLPKIFIPVHDGPCLG